MFLCCTTSEFIVTGSLTRLILIIESCEKNLIADHYDFANVSSSYSIQGGTLLPLMNDSHGQTATSCNECMSLCHPKTPCSKMLK
jgi:hypothetical protein